jgi:hypothetical protein
MQPVSVSYIGWWVGAEVCWKEMRKKSKENFDD